MGQEGGGHHGVGSLGGRHGVLALLGDLAVVGARVDAVHQDVILIWNTDIGIQNTGMAETTASMSSSADN